MLFTPTHQNGTISPRSVTGKKRKMKLERLDFLLVLLAATAIVVSMVQENSGDRMVFQLLIGLSVATLAIGWIPR